MRKLIFVAAAMLSFGSPSTSQAAPVAGLTSLEAPGHIQQIKNGGHGYKGHKGWHGSRHWHHGRGYGRYYGGRLRMLAPMAGELATSAIIAIGKPESAGRDRIHFVQLHT